MGWGQGCRGLLLGVGSSLQEDSGPHVPNLCFHPMILGLKEERIPAPHPKNVRTHYPNLSHVSDVEGILTSNSAQHSD